MMLIVVVCIKTLSMFLWLYNKEKNLKVSSYDTLGCEVGAGSEVINMFHVQVN